MRCEEFRTRAWDRDEETRTHVATCAPCSALAKSLDGERDLLRKARVPAAPPGLWKQIENRIYGAAAPVRPSPFRWLAAAAALLAAAVGIFLFAGASDRRAAPKLDLRIVESPQSISGIVPSYEDYGSLALEERK